MAEEQSIEELAKEQARKAIEQDPVFGELLGLLGEPAAAAVEASIAPRGRETKSSENSAAVQASTAAARVSTELESAVSPTVSDDGFAYEGVEEASDSDVDESDTLSPQLSTSSNALPAAASRSLLARDKRRSAGTELQTETRRQREGTDTQLSPAGFGMARVLENGDTVLHFNSPGQLGIKFGKDAAGHCIITGLVDGGLAETMCKAHGVSIQGRERLVHVGDVEVFSMVSSKTMEVLKAVAAARPLSLTFRTVAMASPRKSYGSQRSGRDTLGTASTSSLLRTTDRENTHAVSIAEQADQEEMKADFATLQALLAAKTRENSEQAEMLAALAEDSKQKEQQAEVLGQAQQVASVLQAHLSKLDMENEELRTQLQQAEERNSSYAQVALELGVVVRVISDSEHAGREGIVQAIESEIVTVQFVDSAGAVVDDAEQITMSVVCPEGVQAGDPIVITTADGEDLEVVLPPGVAAGEEFTVSSPAKPGGRHQNDVVQVKFRRDELEIVGESDNVSSAQKTDERRKKKSMKRFDPSGWKSKKQLKEEAMEKKREEEEAELQLLAERSYHKGKATISAGQADASANKLSRWTKRKAPAQSSQPELNPLQGSFEKSLSSRAPRLPVSDSTTKASPPKKTRIGMDQLEAQLSGLPDKVQANVLERLRNEELLGLEVRRLKREARERVQQDNLARAWQEQYKDLIQQLTLLAKGRLGKLEVDEAFLGGELAEQQFAAIELIRKNMRAAKERASHYQRQLSETVKTKEKNETILHELVADPNFSGAGLDPTGSPGGDEASLRSEIAHLKRTLKNREKMDRTARIVSAEAAVELNEMREKLEVAEHTASIARDQVRNARQQQKNAFEKMLEAQNELHRTSDIVQKKCDDIVALKSKNSRLQDQIDSLAHDSRSQRPRFMRDKKGNTDELKKLRDELHNSTSERQILEMQLKRAQLNIKRLESELEGGEVDFTGNFPTVLERPGVGQPFASPSMSRISTKSESRRVSWHADDVEETLEYERGSTPVLTGKRVATTAGVGSGRGGEEEYYDSQMTPEEARKAERKKQMAAKFVALSREEDEDENAPLDASGQGQEVRRTRGDDGDLLAKSARIRDSVKTAWAGGEVQHTEDAEALEQYRDYERDRHLTRLDSMWEGCTVLKHSTSRGRSKSRHLQLSIDTTELTLGKTTSKQATTTVPLDDVVRVHFGSRASLGFRARAELLRLPEWHCFSLECANGDFVDISTTCDEDAETWCIGLRSFVDKQQGVSLGHRAHEDPCVYRAQQFLWQRATMKVTAGLVT